MRRPPILMAFLALAIAITPKPALGQSASLDVSVTNSAGQPVANLRVALATTGVSTTTNGVGHAVLRLSARVGDPIKLQIVPPPLDLRLMSPYGGDTSVPANRFVGMMVMQRGERVALENGSVLYGLMSRSAAQQAGEVRFGMRGNRNMTLHAGFTIRYSNKVPKLIIPEVAEDSGFTVDQINQAIIALPANDLDWRMALYTAALEFGNHDPFTTVNFYEFNNEFSWGIGSFKFYGSIQRVLRQMQSRNPARFAAILGSDLAKMQVLLKNKGSSEALPLLKEMGTFKTRKFTLSAKWSAHFFDLGSNPEFQRVQIEALHTLTERARNRADELGFSSDRAVAVIYDLIYNSGDIRTAQTERFTNSIIDFDRIVGRPPDERERLALLNNIMLMRVRPNLRHFLADRRCALIYDEPCTRALGSRTASSYGITWRMVRGGDEVRLQDDLTVLDQLKHGWIPSRGEVIVGPYAEGLRPTVISKLSSFESGRPSESR
jgi:hypothetical protein